MIPVTDKRTAIFEAILSLSLEGNSPETLTVSQIAQRAGIGKGTVYEYFPSKEAMFTAAAGYSITREVAEVKERIPLNQGFYTAVTTAMTAIRDAVRNKFSLFRFFSDVAYFEMNRFLQGEGLTPGSIEATIREEVSQILALGEKEGLFSREHPEEYQFLCLMSAISAYLISIHSGQLSESLAMDYAYQMLLKSLA